MDDIFQDIAREREQQEERWGEQNHHGTKWLAILVEEVSEVAVCVNEIEPAIFTEKAGLKNYNELREELIQVAAVCIAWLEYLRRRKAGDVE